MTLSARDVHVHIPGSGSMGCYMATPAKPNGSVLVVLQEIFGVNAYVRGVADSFAEEGYLAIAPDLFWRQEPGVQLDSTSEAGRERATALMKGFDADLAVSDAAAALSFARGQQDKDGATAAVGYCLGGKIAFLLAARGMVDAAVSYYGVGIHAVLGEVAGLTGRLLLHLAQEDHLCPSDAQAEIAARLAPLGRRAQVITYPGVGHAFARRGSPIFNKDMAGKADEATLAFLDAATSPSL